MTNLIQLKSNKQISTFFPSPSLIFSMGGTGGDVCCRWFGVPVQYGDLGGLTENF